jgi:hypothetical protein
MKYPCNIILDLLPLYHDGVCNTESADAIREHMNECENCRAYYQSLQAFDTLPIGAGGNEEEMRKTASLKAVKKKILYKRILASVVSVAIILSLAFGAFVYMENKTVEIEYKDNIEVSQKSGNLIALLSGNTYTQASSILVTVNKNGQSQTNLYFKLSTSLWDDMVASNSRTFSEYVLAYEEKGAGEIDNVYYFIGDYKGLENLSAEELTKETQGSILLWSK